MYMTTPGDSDELFNALQKDWPDSYWALDLRKLED